jgi:thiol-disulfide isomerase/thioredoxin
MRLPASAALAALLAAGCGPADPPARPAPAATPDSLLVPVEATPPLKPGDALPPLVAAGWVNGPPPAVGAPGQALLVVDVWALWCPYCQTNGPALARLQRKYADRGVQFVGVTNTPEGGVRAYCERTGAAWPNGYGMPAEGTAALGAGTGITAPGQQVAPIVYLVGPDGKVRWTDQRARMRHQGPVGWEKELDEAIAAALAPPAATP